MSDVLYEQSLIRLCKEIYKNRKSVRKIIIIVQTEWHFLFTCILEITTIYPNRDIRYTFHVLYNIKNVSIRCTTYILHACNIYERCMLVQFIRTHHTQIKFSFDDIFLYFFFHIFHVCFWISFWYLKKTCSRLLYDYWNVSHNVIHM